MDLIYILVPNVYGYIRTRDNCCCYLVLKSKVALKTKTVSLRMSEVKVGYEPE